MSLMYRLFTIADPKRKNLTEQELLKEETSPVFQAMSVQEQ